MKTFVIKISTCIALLGVLSSCAIDPGNKIRGNRNVITEEREVTAPFDQIKVSQGIALFVKLDEKTSIHIEADENLHDIIKTEIENNLLKIYADGYVTSSKARNVYVTIPNIHGIRSSSGSSVQSENTLISDSLSIRSSSGSTIQLDINTESLLVESSSGSSVKLRGTTSTLDAESRSGSSINSYELESKKATARVSSGGSIHLFATQELNSRASSGGTIRYKGNPELINKKTSSGGSITSK